MTEITKAIFGPKLNFKDFKKVKNYFLQIKLNIDPSAETDRYFKKDAKISYTCLIDPIDIEIENYE